MPTNKVDAFLQNGSYPDDDDENVINTTSLDELTDLVRSKRDCILFGPPGTGKTFLLDSLENELGSLIGETCTVQFHANYSYEEFIQGIVPDESSQGFKYEKGIFTKFCEKATNPEKLYLFKIDEINRANVASVFGEVLYLIENKGLRKLKLRNNEDFTIPENVVIIGTMNTADRTLAKLDFAFRRRFQFLAVYPSAEILHQLVATCGIDPTIKISVEDYVKCFVNLNAKIRSNQLLGKDLQLGHILWIRRDHNSTIYTANDIANIFRNSIFPQLEAYCSTDGEMLSSLVGKTISEKLINGYKIKDEEIIGFLNVLKNSKVSEA